MINISVPCQNSLPQAPHSILPFIQATGPPGATEAMTSKSRSPNQTPSPCLINIAPRPPKKPGRFSLLKLGRKRKAARTHGVGPVFRIPECGGTPSYHLCPQISSQERRRHFGCCQHAPKGRSVATTRLLSRSCCPGEKGTGEPEV